MDRLSSYVGHHSEEGLSWLLMSSSLSRSTPPQRFRSLSLCQNAPPQVAPWPMDAHGVCRLAIRAIGILLEGSLFGSLWGERKLARPQPEHSKTSSAKHVKRPSVTLEGKALPKPCLTLRHGKKSRGTSALVSCLEPLQPMKDAWYKCPINIDNHFSNRLMFTFQVVAVNDNLM